MIHGCTAAIWVPSIRAEKIIAVDNMTAQDDFLKDILQSSSQSVDADVLSVKEAAENIRSGKYGEARLFVVIKSLDQALDLYRQGVQYSRLQLGITMAEKGKVKVQQFNISREEASAVQQLIHDNGVKVEFQYSPTDPAIPFEAGISGKFK